jgi:hypothetical protein
MEKCPNCKERPANFAFRKGDAFVNWCVVCASTTANVFKLKEVLPSEPAKDTKMMMRDLITSFNPAFERFFK